MHSEWDPEEPSYGLYFSKRIIESHFKYMFRTMFIITDKTREKGGGRQKVSVLMKDKKLKVNVYYKRWNEG